MGKGLVRGAMDLISILSLASQVQAPHPPPSYQSNPHFISRKVEDLQVGCLLHDARHVIQFVQPVVAQVQGQQLQGKVKAGSLVSGPVQI